MISVTPALQQESPLQQQNESQGVPVLHVLLDSYPFKNIVFFAWLLV